MEFGYDEYGRRTGTTALNVSDSDADGRSSSDRSSTSDPQRSADEALRKRSSASSSTDGSTAGSDEEPVRNGKRHSRHANEQEGDSDGESGSEFGSDVELVIGEVGTHGLDQPLVEATDSGPHPRHRSKADNQATFMIEESRADVEGLLLLDGPQQGRRGEAQSFLDLVSRVPQRIRNVALIGGLHHGKTSLLSMIVGGKAYRQRQDEVDRCISLKSNVVSALLEGSEHQPTTLVNFVDTPGHPDFFAEAAAGMRLVDSVVLCVDAVESLSLHSERLLRHAVLQENLPVVVVITKVDRLILDLKLPPIDAYRKMRSVVDTVNNIIGGCGKECLVSPLTGSVCFASTKLGFVFSLETFARKYSDTYPSVDSGSLARVLWGQMTFEKGKFVKITSLRQRPTFVAFVLEPLYKIIAHSITGKGHEALSPALKPLPTGPVAAAQDAIRHFCGNPEKEGSDALLSILRTQGKRASELLDQYVVSKRGNMCVSPLLDFSRAPGDPSHDSVVAIAPLQRVHKKDRTFAVVRVVKGALKPGMRVVLVDEHCSDVEPFFEATIDEILVKSRDGLIPAKAASEGQVVFLTGLGTRPGSNLLLVGGAAARAVVSSVADGDELASAHGAVGEMAAGVLESMSVAKLKCGSPLVHIAVELKEPAKAAAFQSGLQTLLRTTPGLDIHKEETGEFTVAGFGELHLDTVLHELMSSLCKGTKIGITQPFVPFSETVVDEKGLLALVGPASAQIGCLSHSLDRGLTERIEYEQLNLIPDAQAEKVVVWSMLRREYHFDIITAQSVMALGPDKTKGPSILFDDLLEEEIPEPLSANHRSAIIRGFRAAVAAGPLTGDVVRGAAVKLIFADVDSGTSSASVLSSARNAVKQALIGAQPRLMEPVFEVEILTPPERVQRITEVLQMRRGSVVAEVPLPATSLLSLKALVPVIESFGLETQLRMCSSGEAFPQFFFDRWDVVPGNPFDTSVRLGPLEPARGFQLARDFVLKTRFRKGLPPDIMGDW